MTNKVILSIIFCSLLASCSNDIRSTLGMRKSAPDEFVVISNPALSVPPEFQLIEPGTYPQQFYQQAKWAPSDEETKFIAAMDHALLYSDVKKALSLGYNEAKNFAIQYCK